jgi:hypothetical protein
MTHLLALTERTLYRYQNARPVPGATRSKMRMVLDHTNAGIMGSNPAWGMDVCLRCVDPPSKKSYQMLKSQLW